jgi:PRTRC genetic system protein B
MNDLTPNFGTLYFPVKAFIFYKKQNKDYSYSQTPYVESYDMDRTGKPINAHPLTVKESEAFAKMLTIKNKREGSFLKPQGFLPKNVLYLNNGKIPCVIWHTPPQNTELFFDKKLNIPCGRAGIPALIWKADRHNLQVFATKSKTPYSDTPLFQAPFFNLSQNGRVCMGNVQVRIPKDCSLEAFINLWQTYFFNSYFTHLLGSFPPVKGNIVQLWQHLLQNGKPFPNKVLLANQCTLKNLLP